MEWYRELKSLWAKGEWTAQCEDLISQIKGKNQRGCHGEADALARIFVEEDYHDRLLKLLQINSENIRFTEIYSNTLTKKYPEEVLEIYENGVKEVIKQTGRKEYRQVAHYLKKMKKINGGGERVQALLKQFLREYNNRPAMRDEFKKAYPEWVESEEGQKKQKNDSRQNNSNLNLF